MKVKPFTIATHALLSVLLLVSPYVSADQAFNYLAFSPKIAPL